jgi:hypothetical protein
MKYMKKMKRLMVGVLLAVVMLMGLPMLFNTGTVSAADRFDRRMKIVNRSSYNIYRFYASNTGRGRWGRDKLGDVILHPDEYVVIDFDDGTGACTFDFRAEVRSGNGIERRNIDVCDATTWTLTD